MNTHTIGVWFIHPNASKGNSCSQNPLKYTDVKTKSMIWMYEDMEGEDEGEDEDVIVDLNSPVLM